MFDLKFYKLVKLIAAFHNDINDYRNHKHCTTKEQMSMVFNDYYNSLNIEDRDRIMLNLYIRRCYLYFNDYDDTKSDKQLKQVARNMANIKVKKYI